MTVAVEYSTVNYKDGLCIGPGGGLVRHYPHVPGIDFAGTVEPSSDNRYKPGDKVVLTGWRVGEAHWGGYAQKARVKADWLVPLPDGLDTRQAMAVGTAGLDRDAGDHGAGGSRAEAGRRAGAGDGRRGRRRQRRRRDPGASWATMSPPSRAGPRPKITCKDLGATQIVPREELTEVTKKPLEAERWAGCVDAVAGAMLGRVLKQMKYGSSVAAIGLAGGAPIEGALITPFILRGVNLLGIDSVMQPYARRVEAWQRIALRPADGEAGGDGAACDACGPAGAGTGHPERPGEGPRRGGCERLSASLRRGGDHSGAHPGSGRAPCQICRLA